jgi:hypothetical protein
LQNINTESGEKLKAVFMQIEIRGLWVKKNFIQAEIMATKFSGIRHPPSLQTLPHTTLHSLDQLLS